MIRIKKHQYVLLGLTLVRVRVFGMEEQEEQIVEMPVHICIYCEGKLYGMNDRLLRYTPKELSKCKFSPVKATWDEFFKGYYNCLKERAYELSKRYITKH